MTRRNTPSKAAVLSVLQESDVALSHDLIRERVSSSIDRATIYRILKRFSEDGIVHSVLAADGKQYFALCSGCSHEEHSDDHFHFQCRRCDRVECLREEIAVTLPGGYTVEGFRGVIVGVCGACGAS